MKEKRAVLLLKQKFREPCFLFIYHLFILLELFLHRSEQLWLLPPAFHMGTRRWLLNSDLLHPSRPQQTASFVSNPQVFHQLASPIVATKGSRVCGGVTLQKSRQLCPAVCTQTHEFQFFSTRIWILCRPLRPPACFNAVLLDGRRRLLGGGGKDFPPGEKLIRQALSTVTSGPDQ